MMALRLLAVFVAARIAMLWGRDLPGSIWTPIAFLGQDVAVVLLFLLYERTVRRTWAIRLAYVAVVLITIASVPVARVLSSPVTTPMLRAARGTLADSFRYHATPGNLLAIFCVLLLAGLLLFWPGAMRWTDRNVARGIRIALIVAGVVIVLIGPYASRRVDTAGLERNPLFALVRSSLPRVQAQAAQEDWRASPFADTRRTGETSALDHLRGAAAGHNVLVVALESTGARYLRAYGAAEEPMPNLTALAARSIVFENAYAVYPESVKGLVALLASRYPGFDQQAERHTSMMTPSLASRFAAAGYSTALFHSGRFFYLGMEQLVTHAGFALLEDAGHIDGNHESSFGVDEASTVKRVLQWIDARPAGRPFFAVYLPIAGHHPYSSSTPGPFPDADDIDRYRNALHDGDVAIGRLLAGLRSRGLDRSTLLLVVGDHGEAFGQHAGNYGHSLAIYEENVRVPLVVALPGHDQAVRIKRIASHIDIAPTLLDLTGLSVPSQFQGSSLLAADTHMALFFADYSVGLLGLRDGCTKVIHELETGRSKAYDVCNDPEERHDLAARMPERMKAYRDRLRRWSEDQVFRVRNSGLIANRP
jgi:phosphoglycerol transferase MdoB-like AlkP superfamily enzyme